MVGSQCLPSLQVALYASGPSETMTPMGSSSLLHVFLHGLVWEGTLCTSKSLDVTWNGTQSVLLTWVLLEKVNNCFFLLEKEGAGDLSPDLLACVHPSFLEDAHSGRETSAPAREGGRSSLPSELSCYGCK